MTVVDPPDLPLWPTTRRLLGLWREEWRYVAIGLVCALGYTTLSLAIPVLISRAIDRAIVPGHISDLWPYVAGILVLSVIRFFINFTRRYATSRVGVHIEARMRELLYRSYLDFPRAFYDRHATGQVVSRATNDLYPIRYFIGWGMVQGVQSVLMIVGAAIVLLDRQRPPDVLRDAVAAAGRAAGLAVRPPGDADLAQGAGAQGRRHRGGRRGGRGDRDGAGVRPRGRRAVDRFGTRAEAVRDVVLEQAVVEAHHLPGLYFLPTLSIAAVLWFGGLDVINGNLLIGQFVLFTTVLLQLAWPLEALGWITNLAQRATASAGRTFAWIEGIDRLPEPARSRSTRRSARPRSALHGVHFAYADEDEVLRGVDLAVVAGRGGRGLRRHRRGQDEPAGPGRTRLRPDRRRG